MLNDLKYAIRALLHTPAFTSVAVLTLAVGIGGTSAMFTVVNRLVLNPLPFPDAQRLVLIWGSKPHEGQPELPFSQPDFEDLRARSRTFDALAAWALGRGNATGGTPEQVQFAVVTANLFDVLGVHPAMGRAFTAAEERPGTYPVAIVSHALWQRRFGGRADAVGRTLLLDNRPLQIVGVLPAGFSFLTFPADTEVWLPLGADPFDGRRFARGARSMGVLGRLRPDVTLQQARAESDGIAASLAAEYPRFNTGRRLVVVPLEEQVGRGVRSGAMLLLGGVGCVLLIGCANVAGLLLARGATRRSEFAVRSALGASRGRLIRHQLAESLALAAAGGAGGLLMGVWTLDLLLTLPFRTDSLYVPYSVPRDAIALDGTALAFTAAVTLLTALIFGLAPALPLSRARAADALRAGVRSTPGRRQQRIRSALVMGEIAAAFVLLATAGLMLRTFVTLQRTDPGFATEGVLTLQLTLSRAAYADSARVAAFYRDALERLAALPGASQVAAVEYLPLTGLDASTGFYIDGRPAPERADEQQTHYRSVSDGYFDLMDIAIVAGRAFSASDTAAAPRVAIVNEAMAQRYWPGESPVGRRMALDLEAMRFFRDRPPLLDVASGMREIVGVVENVRFQSLTSTAAPEMYIPYQQKPAANMAVVLRTAGDPVALAAPARAAIRAIDPDQPIAHLETLSSLVAASVAQPRAHSTVLTIFAVVAVGLAVVGVYGLLAYTVVQRLPELGIRLALGGQPRDLRRMVMRHGAGLAAGGIAIGLPAAIAAGLALRSLLFGVTPYDPLTLTGTVVTVAAVAAIASYVPARRAMNVDPLVALRTD
jgi:putative ABC transport system permease protein